MRPGALAASFIAGVLAGSLAGPQLWQRAQAAPPEGKRTGRLIVGLSPPVTPPEVLALGRQLGARIVNVAPDGAFVLICPKGQSPRAVKRRSGRVTSVDPEVVMGVPQEKQELLLVIPMRRLPGKLVGPPADLSKPKKPDRHAAPRGR